MKKIILNNKLNDKQLENLKTKIGKTINHITVQKGGIFLLENDFTINCIGSCQVNFTAPDQPRIWNLLDLESTYDEIKSIEDQGGFDIKNTIYNVPTLKERAKSKEQFKTLEGIVIHYPVSSPLKSIAFYGNSQKGNITDIYPEMNFGDYTEDEKNIFVDCNSIEFFIFEHEDGFRTSFISDSVGTVIKINFTKDIKEFIEERYSWTDKNIVIQHVI